MAADTQIPHDERRSVEAAADPRVAGLTVTPPSWPSLAALLDLSRELSRVLVPVRPRPEYREELYRRLLAEAHRQEALRLLSLPAGSTPELAASQTIHWLGPGDRSGGRRWIIGAAAVGSAASLVGLLAYVRIRRHGKAA